METSEKRVVLERTLTQDDFDRFAALSGDHNPIHVDAEFSAKSRFGRTVSHGVLLLTILRGLLGRLVPGARLQSQNLMFPAPTYADEPMLFSAEIGSDDGERVTATIRCMRRDDGIVTCDGTAHLQRRSDNL